MVHLLSVRDVSGPYIETRCRTCDAHGFLNRNCIGFGGERDHFYCPCCKTSSAYGRWVELSGTVERSRENGEEPTKGKDK